MPPMVRQKEMQHNVWCIICTSFVSIQSQLHENNTTPIGLHLELDCLRISSRKTAASINIWNARMASFPMLSPGKDMGWGIEGCTQHNEENPQT